MWTDSTGLGFTLEVPKTSYANDVRELAGRGDLGGMSIGFRPDTESWGTLGNRELRTHLSVAALIEINLVSIPTYGSTTVQWRSLAAISTTRLIAGPPRMRARARVHVPKGLSTKKSSCFLVIGGESGCQVRLSRMRA